jgi:Zn-dependent protease/CBS domain-containing protein
MRGWSIPAGRLFGVDIRIHLTFFGLLLWVWATNAAVKNGPGPQRGLALVGIIFGSVIVHELAHALVALKSGVAVRAIILLPIGGVTQMDESAGPRGTDPAREIRISLAGPLANLLLALLFGLVVEMLYPQARLFSNPLVHASNLPRSLVWSNLFLGAFNLLPAYPMDGGHVLRAWLAQRMDYLRATRRAVFIGQGFAMAFMFLGFVWNVWFTLIGFFLFVGAQLEERSMVFQSILENVRMEDVMLTDFATLSPADTLEDALAKAVHTLQDDFPVVRGSDMVGVISKQRILDALRGDGNGYVQSAMNRGYEIAQRQETLAAAFRKITQKGLTLIPVVEDERLIGIVTLQNLMHSMGLLAESKKLRAAAQEE